MPDFPFETEISNLPNIGLIVLQTDETIEQEFRQIFPATQANMFVSRIPSGAEVTRETLGQMERDLPYATSLLPDIEFDAIAYCCTSGASVIGPDTISNLISTKINTKGVTDPVSALLHACHALDLKRLAFLSPYIESVSQGLRDLLAQNGIETPVFGSFNEANDATVAKIDGGSISKAAVELAQGSSADAVFMSCTNLKTLQLIEPSKAELNMPVLSSNFVLAHHLSHLTGVKITAPSLGL